MNLHNVMVLRKVNENHNDLEALYEEDLEVVDEDSKGTDRQNEEENELPHGHGYIAEEELL